MGVAWDTYSHENRSHVAHGDISDKMGKVCRPHDATEQAWTRGRENKAYQESAVAWLREAHRVLRPGGRVKAFGGTRTFHRLGRAMEDVGFGDVSVDAWGYATGFPKSLAVDKALDKRPNAHLHHRHIKEMLKEAIRASGKTRADIDAECGFHACDFARTEGSSPYVRVLPSQERWAVMREVLGVKDDTLTSALADAEREVVGTGACGKTAIWSNDLSGSFEITTPTTGVARSWYGWGTALKPAWEPVLVGTKP